MSISSTGISLGGAVLVPIGTALIAGGGLRRGAPVLGLLVLIVALPVLWAVMSRRLNRWVCSRTAPTRQRPRPQAGDRSRAVPDVDPRRAAART